MGISKTVQGQSAFDLPVAFLWQDIGQVLITLVFAALLSSLPAWLAYRRSPVAALRG